MERRRTIIILLIIIMVICLGNTFLLFKNRERMHEIQSSLIFVSGQINSVYQRVSPDTIRLN